MPESKEERYRRKVKDELYAIVEKHVTSSERQAYESRLEENEQRYLARRSIGGWRQTHSWDKENSPKTEPWENCSDIGYPVSRIMTNELMPSVMQGLMGMKPLTDTQRLGEKGLEQAGEVDDFLNFEMCYRAAVEALREKTIRSAYKFGEGVEKIIFGKKERHITQKRHYLIRSTGKKDKVLIAPDGEPLEVLDPENITEAVIGILNGEDERSKVYRDGDRKGLPESQAMEMAGIKIDQEKETVTVAMLGRRGPNWEKPTTYTLEERDASETVTVRHGVTIEHIPTKDFLFPTDADTNVLMDLDWCGHRYNIKLSWLLERKGDGPYDFFPEVVDSIVQQYKDQELKGGEEEGKDKPREPEIWEIYASFILEDKDEKADNYLQETEIFAWFCPNHSGDKLVGYFASPNSRFDCEHIRPLFLFQVRPKEDQLHGDCIPESVEPCRDMLDTKINQRFDRLSITNYPPVIFTPDMFYDGRAPVVEPGGAWLAKRMSTGEYPRVLQLGNRSEAINVMDEDKLLLTMRLDWGASEALSGMKPELESKTLGEFQGLMERSGRMMNATIKSSARPAELQYQYIMNLYRYSPEISSMEFPTRKGETKKLQELLSQKNLYIRSRTMGTETERRNSIMAMMAFWKLLMESKSPVLMIPEFMESFLKQMQDLFDLENLKVPDKQQIEETMVRMQQAALAQKAAEPMRKAIDGMKNRGARLQVEKTIKGAGLGDVFGIKEGA